MVLCKKQLVVFGGYHDNGMDYKYYNDLHTFDLESRTWRKIEPAVTLDGVKSKKEAIDAEGVTSDMVQDVEQPEASVNTEQPIVVDDGVFTLTIGPSSSGNAENPSSGATGAVAVQVTTPSPRMGSGLCVKHGVLYLYGGIVEDGDKQYTLNDMFTLDLHKGVEWDELIHDEQAKFEWIDSDSESSGMEGDDSSDDDDDEESDEAMEEIAGLGSKKAGKLGKLGPVAEKIVLPVETDTEKLVNYLCGSNILKQGQDVQLKPDSEYPDWLWSLRLTKPPPLEEMDKNSIQYWRRLRKLNIQRQSRLMKLRKY
uniref:EOG090X0KWJ n=1 Tax=Daphnia similis TaxID=35528 RepID=A0A4Y7LPI6_9CRUS|nr:EOG090X0KWJ [Daphnia similis]SVE72091.1 EOG090X0KWJ [Daphnia similis]SVE72718.1 EOG090X0KWJ [Daphnia similis]